MTRNQYRAAIERLGLSQVKAARWLGITVRTSQNYAMGHTAIPEPTARLLRLVIALKLPPEEATKLWGKQLNG
jgi:DNA-binding transcriptional regulator YiaG